MQEAVLLFMCVRVFSFVCSLVACLYLSQCVGVCMLIISISENTICVDEISIGASLMSRHFKIFSIMKNIQQIGERHMKINSK